MKGGKSNYTSYAGVVDHPTSVAPRAALLRAQENVDRLPQRLRELNRALIVLTDHLYGVLRRNKRYNPDVVKRVWQALDPFLPIFFHRARPWGTWPAVQDVYAGACSNAFETSVENTVCAIAKAGFELSPGAKRWLQRNDKLPQSRPFSEMAISDQLRNAIAMHRAIAQTIKEIALDLEEIYGETV